MAQERRYIFHIKRFLPEISSEPFWQTYELTLSSWERVLDGLIKIQDYLDSSLGFRKSCAHGICGSCAMKINDINRLACQTLVKDLPEIIKIEPLPKLPVIKDLVVDMTPFFEKHEKILPYLINTENLPERERLQKPEDQERILEAITCILCGCCTTACPTFWINENFLGPSALLKAYRFIFDTRDTAQADRLISVVEQMGIFHCHSALNCLKACPKEINIPQHIIKLKKLAVKKALRRSLKI
ncbi:MAG: succinate dehydrogenase iron-sulfur subunit [Caldimicrobium sp.]|nr:succinate dehydrogenase iron-sulfur subunit [Caldimicrobium sp.]MCX7873945.1 succinate dehydrogenase iron-sulfur subunit [Caldimicrobium sp.]MDW8094216.1 succinate dehydrogenase iron-sulfur subunit [Caldimicrobium sp.]